MGRKKKALKQFARVALGQIVVPPALRRRQHSEEAIQALAQSIGSRGQSEPILVQKLDDGKRYELVVGSLRVLAARQLGLHHLDGIVLDPSFRAQVRVIRKLQEGTYDPWELADTLYDLKHRADWTQAQLGMAIGRTRDFVANILAIKQIAPEARALIVADSNGRHMSTRHLRYVARAARSDQVRVAHRILHGSLSTTELEREKRDDAIGEPAVPLIRMRELRRPGTPGFPRTVKEWRRYHRQLSTDLRRIDHRESEELRRAERRIAEVRQRQRQVRGEANRRRRELTRELRAALRQLSRLNPTR
ncbi:MAG: ParB N-terminal domain-containing protein [Candidatus Lambdaproteobacteria bacterium]|nr:ParB N-terminal domain-containing protein [Candidatus Lambdaproteobacteria bacterium]